MDAGHCENQSNGKCRHTGPIRGRVISSCVGPPANRTVVEGGGIKAGEVKERKGGKIQSRSRRRRRIDRARPVIIRRLLLHAHAEAGCERCQVSMN